MTDLYDWQKTLYDRWCESGCRGIMTAITGSGKTIGGIQVIKEFIKEQPDKTIMIVSPSAKVNQSWIKELDNAGLKDKVKVNTYLKTVNDIIRGNLKHIDFLIADECHHLANPTSGRVMELEPYYILGLSATPEESVKILGLPFLKIGYGDAVLCDFTIYYTLFNAKPEEMEKYDKISEDMKQRAIKVSGGSRNYLKPKEDECLDIPYWMGYDSLSLKRRREVGKFKSRLPIVERLVQKNIGGRIVIYTELTETAEQIYNMLKSKGYNASIHLQTKSDFKDFEEHKTNILVVCQMLREGWSDVTINTIIMASINTRVIKNIQTIGRALRFNPNDIDKKSNIYFLVAKGTSDERVLKTLNDNYPGRVVKTNADCMGFDMFV